MSLTDQVLALHEGIAEAFILEEKAGHLIVLEESSRDKAATLSNIIGETTENAALGPALILGAATQFSKIPGSLRLVGILYGDAGIILTYIGENKVLAISTETSSFPGTMQLVNDALPSLIKELEAEGKPYGAVKSAAEAEEIARNYVANATKSSRVSVTEVTYHAANRRWEVHGTCRSSALTPSKDFHVELNGDGGAVVSFRSSSPSSVMFSLEIVALIAGLSLAAWIIYATLLAR